MLWFGFESGLSRQGKILVAKTSLKQDQRQGNMMTKVERFGYPGRASMMVTIAMNPILMFFFNSD